MAVSGMTSAGTVIASIAAGVVSDSAGNTGAASTSTDNTVTYSPPPPSVSSINRAGASPTNAASVDFTVTFNESVSGIDTGDFTLATTGTASGTIASVSAASGTSITVTVNTITGDGTLGLNLTDNDSIVNGMSVPLGGAGAGNGNFTGQTYTIDKTAPTVALSSAASNPTNISPFSVTATFSESVTGFADTDISVTNCSVSNFAGSGASYTFDVTPAAEGAVTVNIPANVAQDSAGNNSTAATALSRTYDITAPAVASVTSTTADATYGLADAINITVNFSENVSLALGNLTVNLDTGGTAVITPFGPANTASATYTVAAGHNSTDLNSASPLVPAAGATLKDAAGNDAVMTIPAGQSLADSSDIEIITNTAPTTTGISNVTVNEDAANTTIDLWLSFADTESADSALTYSVTENTNTGLVSTGITGNQNLVLAYTANGSGTATIKVKAADPDSLFTETTFTVTVNAVNDAPVITGQSALSVNEDNALTIALGNLTVTDVDNTYPTGFSLTVQNGTNYTVSGNTVTPSANYNGTLTVPVKVNDGAADSNTFNLAVTVNAVNDNPATTGISNVTVNEDSSNSMINMLTSFNDIEDGTGLVYSVQSNSNPGLVSISISGGNLTLAYTANGNGTANITVRGTDSGGLYAETAFTVTVNAVNDNPATTGISNVTVNEDSSNSVINLLTSFNDIEDGAAGLVYSVQSNSNPGLVSISISGGNLTLAYTANGNGTANITIRGTDAGGLFAETTFTVTVNAVNDNPATTGISNVTVNEDAANSVINLLTSFSDIEDGAAGLVYSVQSNSNPGLANASISGGNLTLAYTANGNGSANITVRGTDSGWLFAETTFTVTVNAGNDTPTTTGISNVTVNEDSANTVINMLTSFNDIEDGAAGLVYSVQSNSNPALISTGISGGNLSLAYTANGNGTANITLRGTDSGGLFTETAFTVTVNAGNDNPSTSGISNVTVNEDSANTVINLLTSFSDIEDGTGLTYTVQSNSNPSLVNTDISGGNLTLAYTAKGNGTANITVCGTDSGGLFAETAFTVTVNAVNDNPSTSGISNVTVNEDSANTVINLLTSFNDIESGAAGLVYSVQSNSNPGLVSTGISGGNLTLAYTANGNGAVNITVRGTDSGGLFAETAFTVTVNPVNDTPVANNDIYSTDEDTELNGNLLLNDTDIEGDTLTAVLINGVSHGTLGLKADGSFVYKPSADYSGADSFTYKANDGSADSGTATVNITVNPVNDAPAADDDKYEVAEDNILTITAPGVLTNDTDTDKNLLKAVRVKDPEYGKLELNENGSFVYTPDANYTGEDSFTYRANDGSADSGTATVTVTVLEVNDTPVAVGDVYTVEEDTVLTVEKPGVLANDADPDEQEMTAVKISDPAHGKLTLNADGSFVYTPDTDYFGEDGFEYKVSDGISESDTATVKITVMLTTAPELTGITKSVTLHYDTDNDGKTTPGDTLRHSAVIANTGDRTASGVTALFPCPLI